MDSPPSPSLRLSPSSQTTPCSSSSSNGRGVPVHAPSPATAPSCLPQVQLQSPRHITRSETGSPYPTTFVQADTNSFKQVVQMLTGSSETSKNVSSNPISGSDPPSRSHIPLIKSTPKRQQSGFKLYERRNALRNFKISPLTPNLGSGNSGFCRRNHEILSPSILDFPSLVLSPVSPLLHDPFDRSGSVNFSSLKNVSENLHAEAEAKAIKEKGFYFHPSPATTPRDIKPQLLPLFPTSSPKVPAFDSTTGEEL